MNVFLVEQVAVRDQDVHITESVGMAPTDIAGSKHVYNVGKSTLGLRELRKGLHWAGIQ